MPRTARGTRTRAKLLQAAETVFASVGYHEASIVKITEEAGVGLGTFYLYFEGKQAIFDEVVEDLNRRVRHAMTDAARSAAATGLRPNARGSAPSSSSRRNIPRCTGLSARPSSSRQGLCGCTTPGSSTATSKDLKPRNSAAKSGRWIPPWRPGP
ncbi:TetR/AcrR family transcriptional regulator [Pseudarthrobacter sp. So.54]